MGNGGGPNTLSGGRFRYYLMGKNWTVDSERARWKIAWLTMTAVFLGLFSGLLTYAFIIFSEPGVDAWMLILAGLMFCAMLVIIYIILHIKSNTAVGTVFKRFSLRPSNLDTMVTRAANEAGVKLVPTEPGRLRRDSRRDWDIHASYSLVGMESRINVVRRFRIKWNRVLVVSFVEMGPKGKGEDEMLDGLARSIDAANIYGQEDNIVEFGEAEARYRAWNATWAIAWILSIIWIALYWGVHSGVVRDATLVMLVEQYHLTLILLFMGIILANTSFNRIVDLSRKVAVP